MTYFGPHTVRDTRFDTLGSLDDYLPSMSGTAEPPWRPFATGPGCAPHGRDPSGKIAVSATKIVRAVTVTVHYGLGGIPDDPVNPTTTTAATTAAAATATATAAATAVNPRGRSSAGSR